MIRSGAGTGPDRHFLANGACQVLAFAFGGQSPFRFAANGHAPLALQL
jgi:hypothetical protein